MEQSFSLQEGWGVGLQRALETASALNEVSDGGCGGSGRFDAA